MVSLCGGAKAQHDQLAAAQVGGEVEAQHVAAQEEIVQGMQDLLQEMANKQGSRIFI